MVAPRKEGCSELNNDDDDNDDKVIINNTRW
jgi:hypothetical protein